MTSVPLLLPLVLAACVTGGQTRRDVTPTLPSGEWGGPHARLTTAATGATLDFDCANGAIEPPLSVNAHGAVQWTGTYTQERPGPLTYENRPQPVPAIYSGQFTSATSTHDDRLVFSITSNSGDPLSGPFTVTLNQNVRLTKCR